MLRSDDEQSTAVPNWLFAGAPSEHGLRIEVTDSDPVRVSKLDARVVTLNLAPGFDDSAISAMIQHAPNLRGLVLQLYGTGNGPAQKRAFINVIKSAIDRGILVVATSQCLRGAVSLDTYEVGRKLLELGVVSAGDMTTEAVVTKMAYVRARAAPERAHVQHAHRR